MEQEKRAKEQKTGLIFSWHLMAQIIKFDAVLKDISKLALGVYYNR